MPWYQCRKDSDEWAKFLNLPNKHTSNIRTINTGTNMVEKEKLLQTVLDKKVDGKKIFGTSFALKKDGSTWSGVSGNLSQEQPYFIASTTKLFTTAIILHLKSEGKLTLEDKIGKYLDKSIMNGLHVYGHLLYIDVLDNIIYYNTRIFSKCDKTLGRIGLLQNHCRSGSQFQLQELCDQFDHFCLCFWCTDYCHRDDFY